MNTRRALLFAGTTLVFVRGRLAWAQTSRRAYRVVSLTVGTGPTPQFRAMERRFRELGYVEGKNFSLDARALSGQWDKIPEVAAELARTRPDVAIAFGSESILRAFRHAMGATPIVFIAVDFDPVEKNYIASFSRPGGNITGVYLNQLEASGKRLELLKAALPGASRVAALFDRSTRDQLQAAREVAARLGVELLPVEVKGNPYDFETALDAAVLQGAHAVLALSSGVFFPVRDKWVPAAHNRRLAVVANPNYADAGALVSFGASFPHMYARVAEYVDRILKGANPAEMPVEQPTHYELVVNLRSAKALGLSIPQSVLLRATRVIE